MIRCIVILFSLVLITTSFGCGEKCPDEIEVAKLGVLTSSVNEIRDFGDQDALIFVDGSGTEFLFERTKFEEGIIRVDHGYSGECENGNMYRAFQLSESLTREWASSSGDTIFLQLFSKDIRRSVIQGDINQNLAFNRVRFLARLVLNGCEVIQEERLINGEADVIETPIPLVRHGEIHNNRFNITADSWNGDMKFAHIKGLIAFNHCGRDWVQRAD